MVRGITSLPAFFSVLALLAGNSSALRAQAFDCVTLNDENTNIFLTPDECFDLPENQIWCNCVRSIFTNPVKNEASGFNQAIQVIVDQPGIGNHFVDVPDGTLDVSGLSPGDVIGGVEVHELIPESVGGIPPGSFFTIRAELRVSAVRASEIDFETVVTEVSIWAQLILNYDPTSAANSNGLWHKGLLRSRGAGNGFTAEYRYTSENVGEGTSPAVSVGDTTGPGFSVRSLFRFFSTESGIYTLPDASNIEIETTLRRFFENGLEEILPLDSDDLCLVRDEEFADLDPCKILFEELPVKNSLEENSLPTAEIVILDPDAASAIPDPAVIRTQCGSARLIFVGRNSTDGDGGLQGLSYAWSVSPEENAAIPDETRNFKDTEITFSGEGEYEVRLIVNDGQESKNSAETTVTIFVEMEEFNLPPTAIILTQPDPPAIELQGGSATIVLDASTSSNGFPGEDDCEQVLTYAWVQVEGPEGATIEAPAEAITEVTFDLPGDYQFELTIDDGQKEDSSDFQVIDVEVNGVAGVSFRRGDVDTDGGVTITDAINVLNWLFLGGRMPDCQDSADADDSGSIDITDGIAILGFLFLGQASPPSPGPVDCGSDLTDDNLPDCSYSSC